MSLIFTCPTDCTFALPVAKFSECSPVIKEGGLSNIFLANVGNPMADWEDLTEWTTRIDNTDTGATKIRALTVLGDVPLPTGTEKTISHKRIITTTKNRVVNFKIDDDSDTNYDFMRQVECGGSFLMWYLSTAGDLYGGDEGIQSSITNFGEVIAEATDTTTVLQGTIKWDARISPIRIAAPMAVPYTTED